ncbi:hypothetical protein NESM_000873700 [Novymonas esmeraldas]|uniref:Uncharacterized protein n=1 Tax=Novymonas esmeraldas TaxID=1808958 RepID=A0AAW0F0E5_9TRYP
MHSTAAAAAPAAAVGASSRCTAECSWADAAAIEACVHYAQHEDGVMEAAESAVQAALTSPYDSSLAHHVGAAAPSLGLRVGRAGVAALCIVSNARVVEIHDDAGAGGAVPLATQEAQLSNSAVGLHAHFLCHGDGGALFPPERTYRVKFFARTPPTRIVVVAVHVILLALSAPPCSAAEPVTPCTTAAASPDAAVAGAIVALQHQLFAMERRVGGALSDVSRRLAGLEARVAELESASRGGPLSSMAVDRAAPADAPPMSGNDADDGDH